MTDRPATELTEEDVTCYFSLPAEALPEAFPEHNTAPSLPMLPKSGCKGLQVCTSNPAHIGGMARIGDLAWVLCGALLHAEEWQLT